MTAEAAALHLRLTALSGPVMFHQSGGCCDGSAPICIPDGEFITSDADVRLGQIVIGASPPTVRVRMSVRQFAYWKHTHLTIDVVPGRGSGLPRGAKGRTLPIRASRLPTQPQLAAFGLANPLVKAADPGAPHTP